MAGVVLSSLALVVGGCDGGSGARSSKSSATTSSPPSKATTAQTTTPQTTTVESYFASLPGSAAHDCVDVDALRTAGRFRPALLPDGTQATDPHGKPQYILNARSGDFAAGNFYQLTGTARPGTATFAAKIYWIPVTPMPGTTLTITSRSLDDPARAPLVVEQHRTSTSDAGFFFWPSATPLPAVGRWEVSASADGLSGCFDVTV